MNENLMRTIDHLDHLARNGRLGMIEGVTYGGPYVPLPNERPIRRSLPQIKLPIEETIWSKIPGWIKKKEVLLKWLIGILITIFGWFVKK